MAWFHYNQNNSGGRFTGPAINVIIEARSPKLADAIAQTCGLYFNGCDRGMDCPCCGDRWSESWRGSTSEPLVYGKTPDEHVADDRYLWGNDKLPEIIVLHADGRQEAWWRGGRKETFLPGKQGLLANV